MSNETPEIAFWPRTCTCNNCLHRKEFQSFEALEKDPLCENCGAHAIDGDGYCWCDMCAFPPLHVSSANEAKARQL